MSLLKFLCLNLNQDKFFVIFFSQFGSLLYDEKLKDF